MPNMVCPYCKKYHYCSVAKSGNLSQVYKCYACNGEFEADKPDWKTTKEVLGSAGKVLTLAAMVTGGISLLSGLELGDNDMPMSSTFS
jgi:hypothetical protein